MRDLHAKRKTHLHTHQTSPSLRTPTQPAKSRIPTLDHPKTLQSRSPTPKPPPTYTLPYLLSPLHLQLGQQAPSIAHLLRPPPSLPPIAPLVQLFPIAKPSLRSSNPFPPPHQQLWVRARVLFWVVYRQRRVWGSLMDGARMREVRHSCCQAVKLRYIVKSLGLELIKSLCRQSVNVSGRQIGISSNRQVVLSFIY